MSAKGRRRGFKSWFVEPYRQVKLGLIVIIINLVFSAAFYGVFAYYLYDVYGAVSTYFQLSEEQNKILMAKFYFPAALGAVVTLAFIITTLLVSVRYTHQIYGPLVSIHKFLDSVLNGKHAEPLLLRQSDQLKDLATKLNQVGEILLPIRRQSSLVPVYRFLDELNSGKKPEPIVLRDGDPLHGLQDRLNALISKV